MNNGKFIDHPDARHFQIRFWNAKGGTTFYFSVMPKENIGDKAEEIANELYLKRGYENASFRGIFGNFKPMKIAKVVEWDRENKGALKYGLKFKIRLQFFEATDMKGNTERREWYQADEIDEKVKR